LINNAYYNSGGTNFKYDIDLSSAKLGTYLSDVQNALKISLENIGRYLNTKVPLQLQVLTERVSAKILAETGCVTTVNTKFVGVKVAYRIAFEIGEIDITQGEIADCATDNRVSIFGFRITRQVAESYIRDQLPKPWGV
jgi:hypothetical protein